VAEALFEDRADAGEQLARELEAADLASPVLLAIPAGGVAVAVPIARRLRSPVYLIVVRKVQLPWTTEAGFGAVTSTGEVVMNERMLGTLGLSEEQIRRQIDQARSQVAGRLRRFTQYAPPVDLAGHTAVIVDDGLASGITMIAAIQSARALSPERVVVAVPVAHSGAARLARLRADDVIALEIDDSPIFAVASFYGYWHDLSDDEVEALLTTG
jgi:putative phosphoribosyl transferase